MAQMTPQQRDDLEMRARYDRHVQTLARRLAEMCDRLERAAPLLAYTTEIARREIDEAATDLGFTVAKKEGNR